MQRARAAGAVAEDTYGNAGLALLLQSKSHARCDRKIAADDSMGAEKSGRWLRQVATAGLAAVGSCNPPQKLGHHHAGIETARQSRRNRAAAAKQLVIILQNVADANRHGLSPGGEEL